MTRKHGKCPACCPDGGAIFGVEFNYDTDKYDLWKCKNCGNLLPRRSYKASGEPTKSQKRILEKLKGFGGTLEYEMIGRNIWVRGKNYDGRKWYDGQAFYGKIGPAGKMELTLQRTLVKDVKIVDEIGLKVYLLT